MRSDGSVRAVYVGAPNATVHDANGEERICAWEKTTGVQSPACRRDRAGDKEIDGAW
ncbi:MAG: hypothetical protein ABIS07_07250 [Dokdonella sp.]